MWISVSKGYNLVLKCSHEWFVHYISDCHLLFSLVVILSFSALTGYRQPHVAQGNYALYQAVCLCPRGCWIVHLSQLGGQMKICALSGLPRVLNTLTKQKKVLNLFSYFSFSDPFSACACCTYILYCVYFFGKAHFRLIHRRFMEIK